MLFYIFLHKSNFLNLCLNQIDKIKEMKWITSKRNQETINNEILLRLFFNSNCPNRQVHRSYRDTVVLNCYFQKEFFSGTRTNIKRCAPRPYVSQEYLGRQPIFDETKEERTANLRHYRCGRFTFIVDFVCIAFFVWSKRGKEKRKKERSLILTTKLTQVRNGQQTTRKEREIYVALKLFGVVYRKMNEYRNIYTIKVPQLLHWYF